MKKNKSIFKIDKEKISSMKSNVLTKEEKPKRMTKKIQHNLEIYFSDGFFHSYSNKSTDESFQELKEWFLSDSEKPYEMKCIDKDKGLEIVRVYTKKSINRLEIFCSIYEEEEEMEDVL